MLSLCLLPLPQADYSLTPYMAIVDPQLVINMPKSLTAFGGLDALTHALGEPSCFR
jgi:acetaldehyde dehydrogenase/alcohol dehydrogenase